MQHSSYILDFEFYYYTTIFANRKWDDCNWQEKFTRYSMIHVVTFVAPSSWMNFPSKVVHKSGTVQKTNSTYSIRRVQRMCLVHPIVTVPMEQATPPYYLFKALVVSHMSGEEWFCLGVAVALVLWCPLSNPEWYASIQNFRKLRYFCRLISG